MGAVESVLHPHIQSAHAAVCSLAEVRGQHNDPVVRTQFQRATEAVESAAAVANTTPIGEAYARGVRAATKLFESSKPQESCMSALFVELHTTRDVAVLCERGYDAFEIGFAHVEATLIQ